MNQLMNYLKEALKLQAVDVKTYSPLVLAYIGDAIYEVIIRTKVIAGGNAPVNKLHLRSRALVNAKTQAKMMKLIEDLLTEEEQNVYKRGRNAKSGTNPKNVSVTLYRIATGFEALIGYLYLKEDYKRMIDLIKVALEKLDQEVEG